MKVDRLMGILTVLLGCEKTTAPELARRFEVSRRTILRDIDALCRAGIPVVTAQGGDGGVSIMEGYKIRHGVLTTAELQSLVSALRGLDTVSKTSNFGNMMLKLAPEGQAVVSLPSHMMIDLSSFDREAVSEKIDVLKTAIDECRTVEFDYYYQKGEARRAVEPYVIEFRWGAWYIFGFCPLRGDFRRFKLNRMWNLDPTGETFATRPVPGDKANAGDVFFDQYNMKILFDKSVRYRLVETYGPGCYEETEDGLLLSLDYDNREHMYAWVLGFGDKAQVLSPPEVRREFAEIAKKMSEGYART